MILTINSGSSSIKFAVYAQDSILRRVLSGQVSGIGQSAVQLIWQDDKKPQKEMIGIKAENYASAISYLIKWLGEQIDFGQVEAIGHRIVHGMQRTEPSVVSKELINGLKQIIAYDPDHLPGEIQLIEELGKAYPTLTQYVCFDTGFHKDIPRVAKIFPIPRRFEAMGVRRYGFHGLSYSYLMHELERSEGKDVGMEKIILAHLGSGASLAAVKEGRSIDTSMGFTPSAGIPMSTRTGDLDPGVASFMMKQEKLSPKQFDHLINHESGLLGISETSADMTELLRQEATDIRSKEAVDLFCYQVKKYIGAYAAALGGLERLIFTGGIGENAFVIRKRICEGLEFLGIELDEQLNKQNAIVISPHTAKVKVYVMHTDEELMIAKNVSEMIAGKKKHNDGRENK